MLFPKLQAGKLTGPYKPQVIFCLLWIVVFVMYIPAAHSGWVLETYDWEDKVLHLKFWDYMNLIQTRVPSLYQFTQLTTYIFYQAFGNHPWPWHLLFITMHVVNATLIFTIFQRLFMHSGVKNAGAVAAGGVILFSICPHISEVLVWKAAFHYLQGMMLMMAVLYWVQQYLYTQQAKYAWYTVIVFFLSTFSLEYFYLTPWFALTMILFYRWVLGIDAQVFIKAIRYFVVPLFVLFVIHIITVRLVTGFYTAHLGDDIKQPLVSYLRKAPMHIFHNLFFGRFFSEPTKRIVYDFFVTTKGLALFYSLFAACCIYIGLRLRHFSNAGKAGVLIFIWLIFCMVIVAPVWIPEQHWVIYDRYAYFMLPFLYLLVSMLLSAMNMPRLALVLFAVYSLANLYFTRRVNKFWERSAHIIYSLTHTLPDPGNKTVLILNLPANMVGIPMTGQLHSPFQVMYNLTNKKPVNNKMYDVVSFNMNTADDGAHVNVMNDSTMQITLNQWGTWWWFRLMGAFSYETEDFKVNMTDVGHRYELTLKKPASEYLLLYVVGDKWKVVNWQQKNVDQN
jgi:hypothetical protein